MTMNLITVKSLETVKLAGITIEWERHNDSVKSITLRDANGGMIKIINPGNYTDRIDILIPQPPKMEDRWVLHGQVAGIAIKKAFESEYEARQVLNDFPSSADLAVTKMEIEVSSDGAVNLTDTEIPF